MPVTNVTKHVGHLQIERLCTCDLSPSTAVNVTQICILLMVTSALLQGLCPCAMLILQPVCNLKGITAQACSCPNFRGASILDFTVEKHTAHEMYKCVHCLPNWYPVDVVRITPSFTFPIVYSGTEQNMHIMRDCVCPAPTLLHNTAVLQPN